MDKKVRCTVIGDCLESLKRSLRRKGILFDVMINSCNPLAMAAETDESNLKYCEDPQMPMPMLLNLRKNLCQMLSRAPEGFCQNYNMQPYATEVRYQNDTDYVIVTNTCIVYPLYQKGNVIYSDTNYQNQFTEALKADSGYIRHTFPFDHAFHWEYFYDCFIDAILSAYDSEHIIFIRTCPAQWHMDGQEIKPCAQSSAQCRYQMEQMERRFIERTKCLCIDEPLNYLPDKNRSGTFAFWPENKLIYGRLERCIEDIVNGKAGCYRIVTPEYSDSLAKNLEWKLSSDVLQRNAEHIKHISEHGISLSAIEKSCDGNRFFEDIVKLKRFLNPDRNFKLSEYVLEQSANGWEISLSLVQLYLRYLKLDINDIAAVYYLSLRGGPTADYRMMAEIIMNHPDCRPALSAKKFRDRNIAYLQNYQHIQPELKEIREDLKLMFSLGDGSYIVIDPCSETPIGRKYIAIEDKADYMGIIEDGYICPIEAADVLCSSFAFYIERARRGEGNCPVRIIFQEREKFCESLYYVDYADILDNENFVLSISDDWKGFSQFSARCDLSFLFYENVNICIIRSGFTDQICYYIVSKRLEETYHSQSVPCAVYLDDTIYDYIPIFNGLEIQKVAKEDIVPRLISNLISSKLLDQINEDMTLPDILFANGCNHLGLITQNQGVLQAVKHCSKVFVSMPRKEASAFLERRFDFTPTYYYSMIRPEHFMRTKRFDLDEYIAFPDFQDERNKNIANKMLSCDAVVIHIRLGDAAALNAAVDVAYFYECMEKLLDIPDYKEKKYFVFSDNIPWVKAHRAEVGLELIGNDEVIFVDHNKFDESYRDLQLMTLAKVIIASGSGLPRMAALLSKRCEQFFTWKAGLLKIFEAIGHKNKYVLTSFSRDYGLEWSC